MGFAFVPLSDCDSSSVRVDDVRSAVLGLKKNICYCSSYSAVECNGCSMVRLWFRGVLKE